MRASIISASSNERRSAALTAAIGSRTLDTTASAIAEVAARHYRRFADFLRADFGDAFREHGALRFGERCSREHGALTPQD